jgi:5-methylcytosine-specific restriction endonuclease McrA
MDQSLWQQVLRTDVSGMPLEWINYQEATKLYCADQVAYTCGEALYVVRGGVNSKTGIKSRIEINSIIATYGNNKTLHDSYIPPLNNQTLFKRDTYLCMYCGGSFHRHDLSRDHVRPISQGGEDTWNNVVTSCKRCNNQKANYTPEQAGMQLLAVPFVPTHAEYIYLQGRKVLADQMKFLLAHFPRTSPLHERLRRFS